MKTGKIAEAVSIIVILIADVSLLIYILAQNISEIPIGISSIISIVSTIVTYFATRFFSFRHNLDRIDLKAIEIIKSYKEKHGTQLKMTDFIANLSAEFGPSTAKIESEDLEERGIITIQLDVTNIGGPPKAVKVVDTTWRARLV